MDKLKAFKRIQDQDFQYFLSGCTYEPSVNEFRASEEHLFKKEALDAANFIFYPM